MVQVCGIRNVEKSKCWTLESENGVNVGTVTTIVKQDSVVIVKS